jgi:hypothetical protein
MRANKWIAACALVALLGCDDKSARSDGADKSAASSKPAASSEGPTKKTAASADGKSASPAAEKKAIVEGLPAQIASKVKLPPDTATVKGEIDLFEMKVAVGMKWKQAATVGKKKWRVLEGNGVKMSVYSFNPSGDDGDDCPKMDAMKKKVKDPKVLVDESFSTETKDNVSYGDEVKLFVFEKGGKFGFYARKMFDHGDDATTYCAAAGDAAEAQAMTGRVGKQQAEELAAMFMSLKFSF